MYSNVKPIFFKAMSGIHAGTGSDLGLVDLPIQRERHTGFPKIESSGIKGCMREEFEQIKGLPVDFVKLAFGPDDEKLDDGDRHAGSIAFTDARLLLFPVRSAKDVFAYTTCPYILKRLIEDFALAGIALDAVPEMSKAQTSSDKLLIPNSGKVVLEEYTIEAGQGEYAKEIAGKIAAWLNLKDFQYIKENLIILSDEDFKDFTWHNTEIITRTKIDNKTGTVAKGALFTEELLPAETVMYSLIMAAKIFLAQNSRGNSDTLKAAKAANVADTNGDEGKYLLDVIAEKLPKYIQLGGDATIGKGLCHIRMGV